VPVLIEASLFSNSLDSPRLLLKENGAKTNKTKQKRSQLSMAHTEARLCIASFAKGGSRSDFSFILHKRLIECDYWEQFESIQRLPQRRPLLHVKG
jgi:hypothetical protein